MGVARHPDRKRPFIDVLSYELQRGAAPPYRPLRDSRGGESFGLAQRRAALPRGGTE